MKKILWLGLVIFGGLTALHATYNDVCERLPQHPLCQNGGGGDVTVINGVDGVDGLSAYEIAQNNGFEGSATQWLESLQGANGQDGVDGKDGIDGKDGVNTYELIYRTSDAGLVALNDEIDARVNEIMDAYDALAEQGLNLSAGANAMAAIDFNADHKGHSIGFGFGFGNTWNGYRGKAGAIGYQYAWTVDEKDVSIVVKTWKGKQGTYGAGFGGVIGF